MFMRRRLLASSMDIDAASSDLALRVASVSGGGGVRRSFSHDISPRL